MSRVFYEFPHWNIFKIHSQVTEYIILTNGNVYFLTKDVNQHIAQGWTPLGGVVLAVNKYGGIDQYVQTMVKYKETVVYKK